jgi:hypothetical protein
MPKQDKMNLNKNKKSIFAFTFFIVFGIFIVTFLITGYAGKISQNLNLNIVETNLEKYKNLENFLNLKLTLQEKKKTNQTTILDLVYNIEKEEFKTLFLNYSKKYNEQFNSKIGIYSKNSKKCVDTFLIYINSEKNIIICYEKNNIRRNFI